jgi:hypothetical protein
MSLIATSAHRHVDILHSQARPSTLSPCVPPNAPFSSLPLRPTQRALLPSPLAGEGSGVRGSSRSVNTEYKAPSFCSFASPVAIVTIGNSRHRDRFFTIGDREFRTHGVFAATDTARDTPHPPTPSPARGDGEIGIERGDTGAARRG